MKAATIARIDVINEAQKTELRVLRATYEYRQMGHRSGQALMNALSSVAPELYTIVSGTIIDCFNQDRKIPLVLQELGYNEVSFRKIFDAKV